MTRIGFYPGSFDPVTNGHIDIARRATKLVDRLVVAVGTHHNKGALFTADERVSLVVDALLVRSPTKPARNSTSPRSTRSPSLPRARLAPASSSAGCATPAYFDYEMQMAGMNAAMVPDVETVFLASSPETRYIARALSARLPPWAATLVPSFRPKWPQP